GVRDHGLPPSIADRLAVARPQQPPPPRRRRFRQHFPGEGSEGRAGVARRSVPRGGLPAVGNWSPAVPGYSAARFSEHALFEIRRRGITAIEVRSVLAAPGQVVPAGPVAWSVSR